MRNHDLLSMAVAFDLETGLSQDRAPIQRRLSAMAGMYHDEIAYRQAIEKSDPLVYEFYDLGCPEKPGEVAFGTSITYPGKIGDEYFMTKGHFHTILETGEVYYCLRGDGIMLMEDPDGVWETRQFHPGVAVYIPPRYAHRSINVSDDQPLVTFFAFRADAGHDYGSIETRGFRKLVVEDGGSPEIVDNPRWSQGDADS